MATSPQTRHRPPIQAGGIRRSFTQPPRSLSFHERAGLDPSDSDENILFSYSHPRARIISFTPPTDAIRSKSSAVTVDLDYPIDTIETLPWKSSNEDLLASGSLSIEKVRGSTNFLKSGSKPLHALMRNSQCWCVDDEATLVMRVGAFKYYRIELPYTTEEEREKVQQLKDVLKRILRFETTPCPFKRGFHIDLPESATTPRKKGPWRRRPGSLLSSPVSVTPSPLNLKMSRARAASEDIGMQRGGQATFMHSQVEDEDDAGNDDDVGDVDGDDRLDAVAEDDSTARAEIPREGRREISDSSQDATSIVEGTRDHPSLALQIPPIEHLSISSSPRDVGTQAQGEIEVSPRFDKSNTGNSPPASSGKMSLDNPDSTSMDQAVTASGEQLDGAAESSSMVESIADRADHSPAASNGVFHLEEFTAEDTAEPAKQSDVLNEEISKEGGRDSSEAMLANEVGEIDLNMVDQPTGLAEPVQSMGDSVAQSPNEIAVEKTQQAQTSEESVEGFEQQRLSPPSGFRAFDTVSVSSRTDSFHSFDSSESISSDVENTTPTLSDPTPVAETFDPLIMSLPHHPEDISRRTVIAGNATTLERALPVSPLRPSTAISEGPSTPSLVRSSASDSSWPKIETPAATSSYDGLGQRPKRKRSFSPLPPPSTLFASPPQSPRGTHLAGAILQRARNLALGKPIEILVNLFNILAVIARATPTDLKNGTLYRTLTERGREHRRNHSLPDQDGLRTDEASEEDDFGVPIRGRSRSAGPMPRRDDDADSLFDLD